MQVTWLVTNQKCRGHEAQSDWLLFGGEEITKVMFRAFTLRYLVSGEGLTFETSSSLGSLRFYEGYCNENVTSK